jgi:hypothetical protein
MGSSSVLWFPSDWLNAAIATDHLVSEEVHIPGVVTAEICSSSNLAPVLSILLGCGYQEGTSAF